MENINIIIEKSSRKVNLFKSVIGNDGENLQGDLVFSFSDEFVNGQGRLEIILPDKTKNYIILDKVNETYKIPILSAVTHTGRINMQLVITEGVDENEIPIFKSNTFYMVVGNSINFVGNEPENYSEWMDTANTKLNQMDNFDIDVSKEGTVATVTITDRTGTSKSVEIFDGEKGETGDTGSTGPAGKDATINGVNTLNIEAGENISINQSGSTLTISGQAGGTADYSELTNKPSINNVELNGNKTTSDLGIVIPDVSDFITKDVDDLTNYYKKSETYTQTEINNKLSAVYKYKGTVSTYGDLPSTDLTVGDVYNIETADSTHGIKAGDNVAWTGSAWDVLAGTVDLSNYVMNTDYASSTGGVIKAGNSYNGYSVSSDGYLKAINNNYSSYQSEGNNSFVGKGTLENVISGKGLVSNTDYATGSVGGVFKYDNSYGTNMANGKLIGQEKTYEQYQSANANMFVAKGTLENVITGKDLLDGSKVKNTNSTTAGDVYDVRYINGLIGDINTILATLTTPSNGGGE